MNRHLHLTFIEQAASAARRVARSASGQGSDPEGGAVFPPIDDPEGGAVFPPIDDPEGGAVFPPVDDPEGGAVFPPVDDPEGGAVFPPIDDPTGRDLQLAGAATALSVLAATSAGCCCGCGGAHAATSAAAQAAAAAPPGTYSGFVIVRLARGIVSNQAETLWDLAAATGLAGLRAALELPFATAGAEIAAARRQAPPPASYLESRPLIEIRWRPRERPYAPGPAPGALSRAETLAALGDLERRTATSAYPPLHSLTAYWRVDLRPFPERVDEVVARFNGLAEVDVAYRELAATDSQTSDYVPDQGYFQAAPLGVDAEAVKGWGTATVKVCDLEQGWRLAHQDLRVKLQNGWSQPVYGSNREDDDGLAAGHHGTAVLGQLAAAGSVSGAVNAFGEFLLSSHYRGAKTPAEDFPRTNGHVAAAIVNVLPWEIEGQPEPYPALVKGDVLLLEVQRGLQPTEIDPADFDAVRLASGLGIAVVEAAGNGGFDLDRLLAPDGRSLNRADGRFRDSGAILVGAARAALPHDRLGFSNYGSRVDCFAWGEAVTSCGYGNLAGSLADGADYYTNTFSGTSSASPVIAAAAALLQSLHQKQSGGPQAPAALRALLADPATGTPQGPNVGGAIGVMPDLGAISRAHGLVPVVYLRKSLCDDGSPLALDEEVSGSPDLLVGKTSPPAFSDSRLENAPALGDHLLPGSKVWVRLRNRGVGPGNAAIQLFASPAATLIAPERWQRLAGVAATAVPLVEATGVSQGDTLHVAPAIPWPAAPGYTLHPLPKSPWTPDPNDPAPRYALLAVLTANVQQPLPPGPPYFDWDEYRAFLRGPGVAMRNVHRVQAASGNLPAFLIANAPDGPHAFAFDIVQRLPQGAQVTLEVPTDLATKMRQRQPSLGGNGGSLVLPRHPRTRVPHVELATGFCQYARFTVTAAAGFALADGHSLALRQLWRGEEVGRITWVFSKP